MFIFSYVQKIYLHVMSAAEYSVFHILLHVSLILFNYTLDYIPYTIIILLNVLVNMWQYRIFIESF